MILGDKTDRRWNAAPFVVRVSTDPSRPEPLRTSEALLLRSTSQFCTPGFRAYFGAAAADSGLRHGVDTPLISLPESLSYLGDGDIVIVRPSTGVLRVLYRRTAAHNSFLVTQACNSFCVMCAQPPSKHSADDCAELLWEAIPLMDINAQDVTFTGGEPTLLGRKLVELIRRMKSFLPHTSLHILSNGRLLKFLAFAQDIADVCHPDLVLGIPLYSDVSYEHDFIVQANGAFDEAVKGILNLARCGLRVEIRLVITRLNYKVLRRFAEFVARNFPFSCNVALMGLEPVGFAKSNLASVWIDPADYGECLAAAVRVFESHRVPVSIYNHQLCTISPELWRFARQSISDWKNIFIDACEDCAVKHQCCGFFASGVDVHSRAIKPVGCD
jgi:His-Xaa-Ser system radical SAM maturase HxsC